MRNFEAEFVNQKRRLHGISKFDFGPYFQKHMLFKKSFYQKQAILERCDFMIKGILFENRKK